MMKNSGLQIEDWSDVSQGHNGRREMSNANKIHLPEGVELNEFSPVAYYDEYLDCIRVVTHDRSVTEHRLSEFFTVHECNHRGSFDPMYVGFTVKGIRHLFHELEIPLEGVYKLTELVNRVVSRQPGTIMAEMLKFIFASQEGISDLTVTMDEKIAA